ncbi:MAG: chromosome partitioning protein ParA, partial [Alphaproteobacteria bacterium]
LSERPAEIAAERRALFDGIALAEARRSEAADRLAEAEGQLKESSKRLKLAEADLGDAREGRVRAEAAVEQGKNLLDTVLERVRERLECEPERVLAVAGVKDAADIPAQTMLDQRLERLLRERETMGPVNLRAETELGDLGQRMETLRSERADLVAAIERLRRGIAEINREARERLLASFGEVDRHFRELFVKLFGGGRAQLALTDPENPLEAGLEIMASPPGKRLQVLSLLSGGERALTSLALLFAVFLTSPAPVCVLDEVDAPLDDANVDRFCTMLEEMAQDLRTRFVLVTHHPMTMARMDRLFGVTMPEPGVSQLVSVDLQRAERLRQTA